MFNTVIECCAMHLNRWHYIIIVFKEREKPVWNFRNFVIKTVKLKLCLEFNKHTKIHFFQYCLKTWRNTSTSKHDKERRHLPTVVLSPTPHKEHHKLPRSPPWAFPCQSMTTETGLLASLNIWSTKVYVLKIFPNSLWYFPQKQKEAGCLWYHMNPNIQLQIGSVQCFFQIAVPGKQCHMVIMDEKNIVL